MACSVRGTPGAESLKDDGDLEVEDAKFDEQLAWIELTKEAIVLLSDSRWKVDPVLLEMKVASAIGPPGLLKALPPSFPYAVAAVLLTDEMPEEFL